MTIKNKLIITLSLFIGVILIANFALAEDDNESETENYYVPVVNRSVPVVPVSSVNPVTPSPTPTEVVQPTSVVSTQEIPENILVDSDADGVIDSLDKYPGKDDFSFNVLDNNKNGVIDELEYLLNL